MQQECYLSSRVSHVVRSRCPERRADAMLQRAVAPHRPYVLLTVHKAVNLLDKLYDTFFSTQRKAHDKHYPKHYIKIEFLDKLWRPVFKEFYVWPEISIEPDPPREKKEKTESLKLNNLKQSTNTTGQKMTRKNKPKIKEKEDKEPKGGYCEMCNADYADAALHRRSPHHLAFVRDHTNFLALDSLISSGADVTTFLDKATPINGERRSLRKMCNGDIELPKRRSKRSQSPDSTMNGSQSPKRNGGLDDEKKHNTRCSKRTETQEDRHYYKVVSTKLRSSGGFQTKRKDSPPACNGTKPLVVKFRKVRRSELSVLSDEAEQFMFPKRASSTSSTSSDDEKDLGLRSKSTPQPPPISIERRRLARPVALKEESSEEDSWPEDKRRRKRRTPVVVKRARRSLTKPVETVVQQPVPEAVKDLTPQPDPDTNPLREEPTEKCMKWEDGKLKYTPAVEQLEFAFESVPRSEPWYETFKRQDQDKVIARNVSQYFSVFSKSPVLPYEMGQLPPLKPNCCPLSDLTKREDKPGPSRSYGTRGMKKQKVRKRTAAVLALESHPRKSPREHASTLAILGSAGLLHRRKQHDDAKSTASEDTLSDAPLKLEPPPSELHQASERLQRFFSELFEDTAELEVADDMTEGHATFNTLATATNAPDVSSLMSECERCDLIRNEIKEAVGRPRGKRGKFKKKNRTGWPNKRKQKKESRGDSIESEKAESVERSSAEPPDDDTARDIVSEEDAEPSELENEDPPDMTTHTTQDRTSIDSQETKTNVDLKLTPYKSESKRDSDSEKDDNKSVSEDEKELKKKKRALQGLCEWLQPVVRVARVETRTLRSAARPASRTRPLR
uniref:DBF4-type domain-containing protein n=1 Tax=Bombyx mori TaxID=7091 RepID=A0A8R2QY63_BOMMO|nr:uncharacterized protein LOC101743721 isoform X3 [Bombyx mori]